jgi:hypothetical protein
MSFSMPGTPKSLLDLYELLGSSSYEILVEELAWEIVYEQEKQAQELVTHCDIPADITNLPSITEVDTDEWMLECHMVICEKLKELIDEDSLQGLEKPLQECGSKVLTGMLACAYQIYYSISYYPDSAAPYPSENLLSMPSLNEDSRDIFTFSEN